MQILVRIATKALRQLLHFPIILNIKFVMSPSLVHIILNTEWRCLSSPGPVLLVRLTVCNTAQRPQGQTWDGAHFFFHYNNLKVYFICFWWGRSVLFSNHCQPLHMKIKCASWKVWKHFTSLFCGLLANEPWQKSTEWKLSQGIKQDNFLKCSVCIIKDIHWWNCNYYFPPHFPTEAAKNTKSLLASSVFYFFYHPVCFFCFFFI